MTSNAIIYLQLKFSCTTNPLCFVFLTLSLFKKRWTTALTLGKKIKVGDSGNLGKIEMHIFQQVKFSGPKIYFTKFW